MKGCFFSNNFDYSVSSHIRVVNIDGQRRQISIRKPTSEISQRNTGDDGHTFFFDAVYDWKLVIEVSHWLSFSLSLSLILF